jgi:hypothetical protein
MISTEEPSAKNWLFIMMETLSHTEFMEMTVTLWAIWYARRWLIHEGEQQSPLSTSMFVRRFLDELALTPKTTIKPSTSRRVEQKWLPPSAGFHKINVDAATTKVAKGGAIACWSEAGTFMGASALTVKEDLSPAALEALACREALALA